MQTHYFFLFLTLLAGMILSVLARKLTIEGAVAGGILGLLLFQGTGWPGIAFMAAFFVLGSMVTAIKRNMKEQLGVAEANRGRRRAAQVLANAGVAGIAALAGWMLPAYRDLATFLTAVCFSSATSDTFSSELGSVYGKKFINILSLKKDQRGLDGVVSAEGFLAGLTGSILIAGLYAGFFGWSLQILWIVLAGNAGNLADSFLGAALERRNLIQNDLVNFLSTLVAALTGWLLIQL